MNLFVRIRQLMMENKKLKQEILKLKNNIVDQSNIVPIMKKQIKKSKKK